MINYFAIACLLGIAAGAPYYSLHGLATDTSYSIPNYGFNYAVNDPHTGDNKAQTEIREGDVVKGSYSLAEPDGTIRIVDYTADPVSGFNAVVKRVGLGAHPQQLLTPVITKAVAAPVLASNPLFTPANIGYSDEGYYDHGLGWGDYDIGDHGSWHH